VWAREGLERMTGLRFLFTVVLLCSLAIATAQDPVKVAPQLCVVPLENAKVRLLETRISPGQKLPMHSHPDYAIYALTTATLRLRNADGSTRDVHVVPGMASWSGSQRHEVENIGDTESRVLHFELKTGDRFTTLPKSF
jgi:quercetin dioxygenase-like cupin family protein